MVMNHSIEIPIQNLLEFRRQSYEPLFASYDNRRVNLHMSHGGLVLTSHTTTSDPIWGQIKQFVNKPVHIYDKRLVSHDFGNAATWPVDDLGNPKSLYEFRPSPGMALSVSYIQVRFPVNAKLDTNNELRFKVFMDRDGTGPKPVIDLAYDSLFKLVERTNTPILAHNTLISEVSNQEMVEVEFKYSDPNSLQGSSIYLRSTLGEYIAVETANDNPVKNNLDGELDNPTWMVVSGKQSVDF